MSSCVSRTACFSATLFAEIESFRPTRSRSLRRLDPTKSNALAINSDARFTVLQ